MHAWRRYSTYFFTPDLWTCDQGSRDQVIGRLCWSTRAWPGNVLYINPDHSSTSKGGKKYKLRRRAQDGFVFLTQGHCWRRSNWKASDLIRFYSTRKQTENIRMPTVSARHRANGALWEHDRVEEETAVKLYMVLGGTDSLTHSRILCRIFEGCISNHI